MVLRGASRDSRDGQRVCTPGSVESKTYGHPQVLEYKPENILSFAGDFFTRP